MIAFELKFIDAEKEPPPIDTRVLAVTESGVVVMAYIWEHTSHVEEWFLNLLTHRGLPHPKPIITREWHESSEYLSASSRDGMCDIDREIYEKVVLWAYLPDGEYPDESVCNKCTGYGKFMENGEEKECIQDREQGNCFHSFCDYEQVGIDLEFHLEDMFDLLSVDEIVNTEQDGSALRITPGICEGLE